MDNELDLENYYLGLIRCNIVVYKKRKKSRIAGGINFDPFSENGFLSGIFLGEVTLLKKDEDNYYDLYNSMYPKELKYKLNETDENGIYLDRVKPFLDVFKKNPIIINEEERDYYDSDELLEKALEAGYYVTYSKMRNEYGIFIVDDNMFYNIREEYFDDIGKEVNPEYKKGPNKD